jgi:hypothetical protein
MTKYKIHIGFITSDGVPIQPGEYDGTEFDITEARRRSYVTNVVSGVADKAINIQNTITDDVLIPITLGRNSGDLPTVVLVKEEKVVTVVPFKINYATETDILNLKHVGKKTAKRVVEAREEQWFENYGDLNKRIPLQPKYSWEDVDYMDFSHPDTQDEFRLQVMVSETGTSNASTQ